MPSRRLTLSAIVIVLALSAMRFLPLGAWIERLVAFAQDAGLAGAVAYSAVYMVATVLLLPGSIFTLAAGLAWGPLYGFMVVYPGALIGAVISFLLGRTLLRSQAERLVSRDPRFHALDEALAEGGFLLVLLMRLSPIFPFTVLNFGLGLTRISTLHYAVATAIGILPGTFLYAYLGSSASSLADLGTGSEASTPGQQALYWAGLIATLGVTVYVTRIARRALSARIDTSSQLEES